MLGDRIEHEIPAEAPVGEASRATDEGDGQVALRRVIEPALQVRVRAGEALRVQGVEHSRQALARPAMPEPDEPAGVETGAGGRELAVRVSHGAEVGSRPAEKAQAVARGKQV